jgi:hypothetical protein
MFTLKTSTQEFAIKILSCVKRRFNYYCLSFFDRLECTRVFAWINFTLAPVAECVLLICSITYFCIMRETVYYTLFVFDPVQSGR